MWALKNSRERERGALKTKIHKTVENAHHYAPNKFLFQDNGQPCDSSGSSDSVKQKGSKWEIDANFFLSLELELWFCISVFIIFSCPLNEREFC